MNIQEVVDSELMRIRIMFENQKELYPSVILLKNERRFQIPAHTSNNANKDIVSQGIKDLVKKTEPEVVVYFAEAWMTVIKDKLQRLGIDKSTDHMEIVVAQIEFKSGEKFSRMAKIQRNGAQVKLDKFETLGEDLTRGRFMDFFPHTEN
jgi:hypothetical protein